VRARLGLRAWRAVHWLAYACWPVALLHGLGTGTDASTTWLQALAALCAGAVAAAVATRLVRSPGLSGARRAGGLGIVAATLAAGTAFAVQGPLQPGWARRAGTPVALLGSASSARSATTAPRRPTAAGSWDCRAVGSRRASPRRGRGRSASGWRCESTRAAPWRERPVRRSSWDERIRDGRPSASRHTQRRDADAR